MDSRKAERTWRASRAPEEHAKCRGDLEGSGWRIEVARYSGEFDEERAEQRWWTSSAPFHSAAKWRGVVLERDGRVLRFVLGL